AFMGFRFSKNVDTWTQLVKGNTNTPTRPTSNQAKVNWIFSGLHKTWPGSKVLLLREELEKVEPTLLRGNYAEAKQMLPKAISRFLMAQGYLFANFHIKQLVNQNNLWPRRQGNRHRKVKSIDLSIHFDLGEQFSLDTVQIEGWPEGISYPEDAWFQSGKLRQAIFNQRRLELFQNKLLTRLADNGYANAQVAQLEVLHDYQNEPLSLSDNIQQLYSIQKESHLIRKTRPITLKLKLKPKDIYSVNQLTLRGNHEWESSQLKEIMGYEDGKNYREAELDLYRRKIESWYIKHNFIGTQVIQNKVLMSRRYPRISLHYTIKEGERWNIGEIVLKNLSPKQEAFVRSRLILKKGEAANSERLEKALGVLNQLNLFRSIEYKWGKSINGSKDITFSFREQAKISFASTIGYETGEGLLWALRLNLANLGWRGQSFSLANDSRPRESFQRAILKDPFLFDSNFIGSASFALKEELITTKDIVNKQQYTELSLARHWTESFSQIVSLAYREDDNPEGREQSMRLELFSRQNAAKQALTPAKGFGYTTLNTLINYFEDKEAYTYTGDYTLSYGFKFGGSLLTPWVRLGHSITSRSNSTLPLADRFFLGGVNSLRGFREDDIAGNDGEGGASLFSFGLQLFYPLESYLDGTLFYEAGQVFEDQFMPSSIKPRAAIGMGLVLRTPVGPIQGFVAKPVAEKTGGRFGIQMGTIF
ncbi:MAG: BamA/TamA family outer membrane protein, partial [Planctomycetes bacterium]|nr:BamA/TamA family outer membrane protein [Planctomycetota bacterium]